MNLQGYMLSGDHALLAKLMQTQTIICVGQWADHYPAIGNTIFDSAKGNDGRPNAGYRDSIGVGDWQRLRIIATGKWQIDACTEAEFFQQCEKLKIQFVIPNEH